LEGVRSTPRERHSVVVGEADEGRSLDTFDDRKVVEWV
jgi:hypothetical protein